MSFGQAEVIETQKNVDPYDFSDRYNTKLSHEEEAQFQKWAKMQGREKDVYPARRKASPFRAGI